MHDQTLCMLIVGGYFVIAIIVCVIFNIYYGWNKEEAVKEGVSEVAQFVGFLWPFFFLLYFVLKPLGASIEKSYVKSIERKKMKEVKTTPVPFAQFSLNPEFRCPVCKETSRTDDHHAVIFCSHCRAPHHVNCYKEIGHCSTYGCRGEKDPITYQMPCECP